MSTDLVLPGAVSETGLDLPVDLSYEEWERVGGVLGRIGRAHQWWVGDWLNYGERAYGEKYAQAMDTLGLEYSTVSDYAWVARAVTPSVRTETLSWSHHKQVASLSADEQAQWLVASASSGWNANELRGAIRERKALDPPPLPEGQYRVIYADPPWPYDRGFVSYPGEDADTQRRQEKPLPYPSMSLEAICDVKVPAAQDAALFLWTTTRFLPDAFRVVEAWAFDYRHIVVWNKTGNPSPFGKSVTRLNAEFLLYATRGDGVAALTTDFDQIIAAQKPYSHSTKPDTFRGLIEAATGRGEDTHLELFGRKQVPGWTVWGNEA